MEKLYTMFRKSLNNNFFSKPNLLNSYWAGFIAADGGLVEYGNKLKLVIGLSNRDKRHLISFKNDLESSAKITLYKNFVFLQIYNDKLCLDLKKNFNITPRKSLTLKPPRGLTKKQALAFIVGYIDGDGCIDISDKKYKYLRLRIMSTKAVLFWVLKILDTHKSLYSQDKNYVLKLDGKKALTVLKKLAKVPIPKMKRKWNKLHEV